METRMYASYGVTDAAWETPPVSAYAIVILFAFLVTRRGVSNNNGWDNAPHKILYTAKLP